MTNVEPLGSLILVEKIDQKERKTNSGLVLAASVIENELTRAEAIIHSMTPSERQEPKIINGSRRARIARGSGTEVFHVNNVLDRFSAAQKAMKQMRNQPGSGGAASVPGMPPMSGMPAQKVAPPPKKSKSGNPAKRALEGR
jgi:signal recognition particle subunit SRP54